MTDKNLNINIIAKDKSKQALGKLQGNLGKTKASVLNLKNALIGLGAGLVIRSIIQTTSRFEDLRTSLSSVTGSAEEGAKAFDFITGIATKTQFSVEDLSKSFIKLKAAGITPSEELLNIFTNTAAITTDQIGSLEAVTDLYARTVSGGLGLEEIQRLGDRGVPILRILEQELNLNRSQISEFGKSAEGAKKIVEAFGRGIQKEFGGATEALLGNISVSFSNLGIAVNNVKDKIGQGMSPAIRAMTDELTKMLEENEELASSLGKGLGGALADILTITLKTVEAFQKLNETLEDNRIYELFGTGLKDLLVDVYDLGFGMGTLREEFPELASLIDKATNSSKLLSKGFISVEDSANAFQLSMKEVAKTTKTVAEATTELTEAVYDKKLLKLKDSFLDEKQLVLKKQEEEIDIVNKFLEEEKNITRQQKNDLEDLKIAIYLRGKNEMSEIYAKEAQEKQKRIEEDIKIEEEANEARIKAIRKEGSVLENLKENYATFLEDFNEGKLVADALTATFAELTQGIGDAVAQSIVFGKSFKETFGDIAKKALASLISALVQVGVQIAFNAIISAAGMKTSEETTKKSLKEIKKEAAPTAFLVSLATSGTNAFGAIAGTIATFAVTKALAGRRTGGQVTGGTPYLVGEQGPELFQPNQSGTIVPNDRLGGGQNINITINANDTQGFDELLIKRRATIVNVINDALNSQGKEALV